MQMFRALGLGSANSNAKGTLDEILIAWRWRGTISGGPFPRHDGMVGHKLQQTLQQSTAEKTALAPLASSPEPVTIPNP